MGKKLFCGECRKAFKRWQVVQCECCLKVLCEDDTECDSEGVPLCRECMESLIEETRAKEAKKAAPTQESCNPGLPGGY